MLRRVDLFKKLHKVLQSNGNALRDVVALRALQLKYAFYVGRASFIVRGVCIGVMIGLVVGVFRWILNHSLAGLHVLYPYLRENLELLPFYVLGTIVVGFLLKWVAAPLFADKNPLNWWGALWRTFVGALLAICPGIFAGREGPCINMGAYIAEGFCDKVFKDDKESRQILVHSGMAAGLGAAFSVPIAGTLFLLEAISFNYSPVILFTSMTTTISAVITTYFFFGTTPAFFVSYGELLPLEHYWVLFFVGIFIGVSCRIFQGILFSTRHLYGKLPFPKGWNVFIPLLLVIPIGLIYAPILGGSHDFIQYVLSQAFFLQMMNEPWQMAGGILALMLVTRLIFTSLSCSATAPTGIFMPILVLGAVSGALIAILLIKWGVVPQEYYLTILVSAMAAYFGISLKAPFTAVILLVETIGDVNFVMPILIVTWIGHITNTYLKGKSVYA